MYHSTVRPAESAIFGPIWSVGHQITQEAVCANTAYKRHFIAKCHNLDSPAIWEWFLIFLYIRFHNLFSFWGSGPGIKLEQFWAVWEPYMVILFGQYHGLWTMLDMSKDMWNKTCDTCNTWLVTCGMLQVTCDMSHMTNWNVTQVECTQNSNSMHASMAFPRTCNVWHVTCDI